MRLHRCEGCHAMPRPNVCVLLRVLLRVGQVKWCCALWVDMLGAVFLLMLVHMYGRLQGEGG